MRPELSVIPELFFRQGAGGGLLAETAKGPLLLSHTSHPHILWGIRGTFAKSVVFAKVRCAAAAVLAASIAPRHPQPPPLSLDEEGERNGVTAQGVTNEVGGWRALPSPDGSGKRRKAGKAKGMDS